MGHISKTPWELAELEKQNVPRIAQITLSSSLRVPQATGHCWVDLKLGNSGDLEVKLLEKFKDPGDSSMESSSGSSKRARTPSSGTHVPSCLVDGCAADLSKCRDYHRRHKVCELHSKTSRVFIKGQEQRFCQQCSRFHSLVEFDEGKRSCRKRLDGHNRRRRKPQPDSVSLSSTRLFPDQQGTRYLQFGGSQLFSTSATSSGWVGTVKAEGDPTLYNNQSLLDFGSRKNLLTGSLSHSYEGGKQLSFLQGVNPKIPGDSFSQSNLGPVIGDGSISQKMVSDGLNRVVDSNGALSLLSSPPPETREIGNHIVRPDLDTPSQSLIQSLNYNGLGMESEPVGSILVSDGRGHANLHGQNMFQIGPDGSSASGSHRTLSFSWE